MLQSFHRLNGCSKAKNRRMILSVLYDALKSCKDVTFGAQLSSPYPGPGTEAWEDRHARRAVERSRDLVKKTEGDKMAADRVIQRPMANDQVGERACRCARRDQDFAK